MKRSYLLNPRPIGTSRKEITLEFAVVVVVVGYALGNSMSGYRCSAKEGGGCMCL
jgi:hypothetical protein